MKRLFSGKFLAKTLVYTTALSFVGINFFTLSHTIRHEHWDPVRNAPKPKSGLYMDAPPEINDSSKELKLFYTLHSNEDVTSKKDLSKSTNHVSSSSESKIQNTEKPNEKKLVIFIPDIAETREVFQDLEYHLLHSKELESSTTYTLRYDRYGYGYSDIVKGPRHLHNMSIELHNLVENVLKNNIIQSDEKVSITLVGHGFGGMLARMYLYKFASSLQTEYNGKVNISKSILISPLHERFIQYPTFYLDYLVDWKARGLYNRLFAYHGFMEWFFKLVPNYSLERELIDPFVESISPEIPNPEWTVKYSGRVPHTDYDDTHLLSREEMAKRMHYHLRNDNLWKTIRNETTLFKRSCVQLNGARKIAESLSDSEHVVPVQQEDVPSNNENLSNTVAVAEPINTSAIDVLVVDVNHDAATETRIGRKGIQLFFDKNNELSQTDFMQDLIEGYSNKSKVVPLNNYNHYSVLTSTALAQQVIDFVKK
ncbi:hypothetical protein C9374_008124 [Naegleria lovaniensis]|uniref:AB hydrolase-1 domain-containing protein n=1 Tax=Naegleria lovaniensis TaxID=51637 RepID=A0AA88GKN2_NAELO|nr:uncharacterized protein C9374_008124 [Naegleria lovaniensis]KAG2378485.1 hypothetical protein C9374_008124 [Naegleria lovaniensis]